jgi:hypothetical protein
MGEPHKAPSFPYLYWEGKTPPNQQKKKKFFYKEKNLTFILREVNFPLMNIKKFAKKCFFFLENVLWFDLTAIEVLINYFKIFIIIYLRFHDYVKDGVFVPFINHL